MFSRTRQQYIGSSSWAKVENFINIMSVSSKSYESRIGQFLISNF